MKVRTTGLEKLMMTSETATKIAAKPTTSQIWMNICLARSPSNIVLVIGNKLNLCMNICLRSSPIIELGVNVAISRSVISVEVSGYNALRVSSFQRS